MPAMISKNSMNIVKSSAVLITRNATEITQNMYKIMFEQYPKIEKLFANAPQDQYMKLADAISAYAINIDKLHILKPALMVIAKTHVRTNIQKSHYPIVGDSLLQAIQITLGDAATPEFMNAWKEAYQHIAEVLIEMEEELYKEEVESL